MYIININININEHGIKMNQPIAVICFCWESDVTVRVMLTGSFDPQGQIRKRRSAAGVRMPLSQGLEDVGDWS